MEAMDKGNSAEKVDKVLEEEVEEAAMITRLTILVEMELKAVLYFSYLELIDKQIDLQKFIDAKIKFFLITSL